MIFVGYEIRDGNSETRSATVQSSLNSEMDLLGVLSLHASTWDKVMTDAPLDSGEEMRRGILLYNMLMTESENRFYQFNSGYLDSQSWEGCLASLEPLVRLPIYDVWRKTPGGVNHSLDFLELLTEIESGSDE